MYQYQCVTTCYICTTLAVHLSRKHAKTALYLTNMLIYAMGTSWDVKQLFMCWLPKAHQHRHRSAVGVPDDVGGVDDPEGGRGDVDVQKR